MDRNGTRWLMNPDRIGAVCHATGLHALALVECECGARGLNIDDERERAAEAERLELDDLVAVSACTCGQPVCNECWQGSCPHG